MAFSWQTLAPLLGAVGGAFIPGVGPILGGLGGSLIGGIGGMFGPSIYDTMRRSETDALNFANSQNMPYYNELMQTATGEINTSFNKEQRDLISQLSGTGMSRSGIGAASLTDLQAKRGQTLNKAISGVNEQNLNWRMNLVNRLLGMGEASAELQNRTDIMAGQGMGQITGALLQRLMSMPPTGATKDSYGWNLSDTWNTLTNPQLYEQMMTH